MLGEDDPRIEAGFERLHRWKQAASWAPILGVPLVIYWLMTDRVTLSIGLLLAGFTFVALARGVVWMARCPGCETRFRDTPAGFARIWNEAACAACERSYFELRRGRARD